MTHLSGRSPAVGIVMGSDSDWPVMRAAAEALAEFGVGYEADVGAGLLFEPLDQWSKEWLVDARIEDDFAAGRRCLPPRA